MFPARRQFAQQIGSRHSGHADVENKTLRLALYCTVKRLPTRDRAKLTAAGTKLGPGGSRSIICRKEEIEPIVRWLSILTCDSLEIS